MNVTALRRDNASAAGMQRGSRYGRGGHRGPTAPGFVQGNLAPLASDFLRFCHLNPKPCPLIGTSAPGDPRVPGATIW
jgi:uncharacterized protein YcsI (UPF0317 family)